MAEVRSVECRTCHGTPTEAPLTRPITDPDDLALRQASLNPASALQVGDTVVVTDRGDALWNVLQQPDGAIVLTSKVSGTVYAVPQVSASACEQDPQDQAASACHECHAVDRP